MADVDTPLVFVICNDYGELALAMYLLEQQPFAQNVTLMLPPQLHAKNPDVLPGRTLVYHSLNDVQRHMLESDGGILGLFSGYLLPNHRLCDTDHLEAFLQWADRNDWNTFTSDPFLGLLDSVDPADLVTLKSPGWNIIWYLAAQTARKRVSSLLADTHDVLGDMLHVYPVGDTPNEMDTGFDKRLHIHNDALASLAEIDTETNTSGKPSRWLFVLGDQDYTVQLGKYGRFSRKFPNLLMSKLHETLEAGRLPTLVAPTRVIDMVRKRSPAADSIDLLSHCDYHTFQRLLAESQYVFYWNAVSFTCIQRTLTGRPWFTFDDGHLLRGMNSDYNNRITEWFYREAKPPYLDIRKELTTEGLQQSRMAYMKNAWQIRDGLLSTHDAAFLLEAWEPLARKTVTEIFDIVIELGEVVARAGLDGNTVVDESLLSHPKSVIRTAANRLLERDIGDEFEYVCSSVMTLPFFQPGLGEARLTLDAPGPEGKPWRETVQAELIELENNLLKPLAPNRNTQATLDPVTKTLDIVVELGRAASNEQLDGNTVVDISLLSHTKSEIKAAVADLLERDIGEREDFVRSVITTLPFFQSGVGNARHTLDSPDPNGEPWRETVQAELREIDRTLLNPSTAEPESAQTSQAGTPVETVAKTLTLVVELGQVISSAGVDGHSVVDEGLLPCSKEDIKTAVASLLTHDIGDQADFVRSAVMTLPFFQAGIGEGKKALDAPGPDEKSWREVVQTEMLELERDLFTVHSAEPKAQSLGMVVELGKIVSSAQLDGNTVVDEQLLPHTKEDIRFAVQDLLKQGIGQEDAFVRSAVMTLPFFQPGVGDERRTLDSPGPGGKPWRETVQAEMQQIKTSLLD